MKVLARLLFIGMMFFYWNASSQNTYDKVYSILQSNCSGTTCHSGPNAVAFDVTDSKSDLYNAIFETDPENTVALEKGDKLVDAGYPGRSFLLRKMANGLSDELLLSSGEGDEMPTQTPLSDKDIEIIRQWILWGAPETGAPFDEQLIADYYNHGGVVKIPQPPAPDSSEGFQIHLGPIFLAPQEEKEFFKKYDLQLPADQEITRMEVTMNDESHHFILYKFESAQAASGYGDELRNFNVLDFFNNDTDFLMAWQNDDDVELPEGTAYFWDQNSFLDLNYHIFNFNIDKILPSEVFINIYTQPSGTAQAEMQSALFNNALFIVPNDNQPYTFTSTESWNGTKSIWNIVSHTHKYGIDYDVFLRNSDGSRGTQIYEGFFNFDYTFNQGFFEWDHPPIRYFQPLLHVDHGLIHEATYRNNGPRTVTFGFTTEDEMMIIYVQYVEGKYDLPIDTTTTNANLISPLEEAFQVYPNPFENYTEIFYNLTQANSVALEIYNLLGQQVAVLVDENQSAGNYSYRYTTDGDNTSGVYFIKLSIGEESVTRKLLKIN